AVLGLLSLLCISEAGRAIAILAAITIIGLPITVFMGLVPTLFVIFVLARLIYMVGWVFGLRPYWVVCAVVGLGLLAVIPYFENQRLSALAEDYLASDKSSPGTELPVATLAVVQLLKPSGNRQCDDLCQRALLNGQVKKVIMGGIDAMPSGLDKSAEGMGYWLEEREKCPVFHLRDGFGNLRIDGEKRKAGSPTPSKLLHLKASNGICFIQSPTRISDADTIIFRGSVAKAPSAKEMGFRWDVDAVSADRISVYSKDGGHFSKRHQDTIVKVGFLWPVLMPTYVGGYGLEIHSGLGRQNQTLGSAERDWRGPRIEPILTDVLKLDLVLRTQDADNEARSALNAALQDDSLPEPSQQSIMDEHFSSFGRGHAMPEEDALLALKLLENRNIPAPRGVGAAVRMHARNNPQLADRFANALFQKIAYTAADERENKPSYLGYRLSYISGAIYALPDSAILSHRRDLEALARNTDKRIRMGTALTRLSAFGEEAVPTFIYLIDDADTYRQKRGGVKPEWQVPYLAGMQGLCLTGSQAKAAIPMIFDRLDSGQIATFGPYWKVTINTLMSIGADPEEIWLHLPKGANNQSREHFDRQVRRSQAEISCGF
ncbi:MAG: hypothetical protein AAGC96_15895, partial [Pseudomonadota bacterium]